MVAEQTIKDIEKAITQMQTQLGLFEAGLEAQKEKLIDEIKIQVASVDLKSNETIMQTQANFARTI